MFWSPWSCSGHFSRILGLPILVRVVDARRSSNCNWACNWQHHMHWRIRLCLRSTIAFLLELVLVALSMTSRASIWKIFSQEPSALRPMFVIQRQGPSCQTFSFRGNGSCLSEAIKRRKTQPRLSIGLFSWTSLRGLSWPLVFGNWYWHESSVTKLPRCSGLSVVTCNVTERSNVRLVSQFYRRYCTSWLAQLASALGSTETREPSKNTIQLWCSPRTKTFTYLIKLMTTCAFCRGF